MASIQMEGRAAANAWKARAQELNERTERLLNEVSTTLESVREYSEGSLVDEIVALGASLATATNKLLSAMNGLFDVVNNLLNLLESFISGSTSDVQKTKSYL